MKPDQLANQLFPRIIYITVYYSQISNDLNLIRALLIHLFILLWEEKEVKTGHIILKH